MSTSTRLHGVAVCVPTIATRGTLLARALTSVTRQSLPPAEVHVVNDVDRRGAAATRNETWRAASTTYVAFLDDDDELHPHHLERLRLTALETGADVVYPWFDLPEAADPLAVRVNGALVSPFGVPFGDEQAAYLRNEGNFIPVTVLVRRDALAQVGGFPQPGTDRWPHATCEDWGLWRDLLAQGASFVHVPERTWTWHHHGANTSGDPTRW